MDKKLIYLFLLILVGILFILFFGSGKLTGETILDIRNSDNFILVSRAEHLDENRAFVVDIFEEVRALDGNWSETIPSNHYVRVTFERNLTSERDITVYPRTVNGVPRIEIYEYNETELIAEFESLNDNEYNKVFLSKLEGEQDTFDLLILNGSVEFDHIIDPTEVKWADLHITGAASTPENALGATDGLWTTDTGNTNWDSRFSMENPSGPLTGTQTIRVLVRKDSSGGNDPTVNNIDLYENGVLVQQLVGLTSVTSDTGQNLSGTFDSGAITNPDDVEIFISTAGAGGQPSIRRAVQVDSIVWEVNFLEIDNEFPIFSNFQEFPENNTAYVSEASYEFNSTIISTNGTAGVEFNAVNYTASNLTSSLFNFTINNLGAGTYPYYWFGWGNGTSNNYNTSSGIIRYYTVAKASQSITPLLNGNNANIIITYPQQINASYSGTNNTPVIIDINSTQINIAQNLTWGAGGWVVNYSLTQNQNYTGTDYFLNLTINRASSEVNLDINFTEGNITIEKDSQVLLNGTLVTGDNSGRLLLYNNGDLINNNTVEASNQTTFSQTGLFNITIFYQQSQNYTSSFETYYVNVTGSADDEFPIFSDYKETPANNTAYSVNGFYELNVSVANTNGTVGLEFNGVNYTATNSTAGNGDEYNVSLPVLGAGTYPYYWFGWGNGSSANYNTSIIGGNQRHYTVAKETGDVEVYLNNQTANITVERGSSFTYNSSRLVGEGTAEVYEEGILVANGTATTNTTTADSLTSINITAILRESQNYTSDSQERWIDVEDTIFPLISIVFPENNTNHTTNGVDVNYTVSDSYINSCKYTNSSGEFNSSITCGTNLTDQTWDQGNNVVTIYAADESGNENSSTVSFFIDSAPPTISFVAPTEANGTFIPRDSILINVSATDASLQNITIRLYNSSNGEIRLNSSSSSPFFINYSSLDDGIYYFNATATDITGNQNSTETRKVTIDTTTPLANYVSPTENSGVVRSRDYIEINSTATDTNLEVISVRLYNSTQDQIESNFSLSSPFYINYSFLSDGLYYYNVSANDSAGNSVDLETRNITLDNEFPLISLVHPENTSYNFVQTELNYTVFDNSLGSCWYSVDSGLTNTTIICGNNVSELNSGEGSSTWTVYVNDSSGNENSSSVSFFVDSVNPSVTELTENPSDPATYSSGVRYEFNATVTDENLQTVLVEFEGINYTVIGTGNIFNFTISDLAAGNYNYYWRANDSVDNVNVTSLQTYTINEATGNVTLLLNGSTSNQTAIFGVQTNASATTSFGTITLYRNGVDVTSENHLLTTLGVGDWNYTAVSSGDQNHSSESITRWAHITRANSEVNLTLNSTEANITINQGTSTLLNGTLVTGDNSGRLLLYNNGDLINNNTVEASNQTTFSQTGLFNITIFYQQSQNYSISSETYFIEVVEAPDVESPAVSGLTETPSDPANYSESQIYEFNATITDNIELDSVLLEFNAVNYTAGNIAGDIFNVSIRGISAGNYTYIWYANDTSGNVNNSQNGTYIINQATPSLSLSFDPSNSITYPTKINVTGSGCSSQIICNLYRNEVLVNNSEAITLGAGTYDYIFNTTGNANYTNASVFETLTVQQGGGEIHLFLDNSRANTTIQFGDSIYLNATLINGSEAIQIYNNGSLINNGTSPLSNLTTFADAGLYNITAFYFGDTNYTPAFETFYVNVTLDITTPAVIINSPLSTTYSISSLDFNVSLNENGSLVEYSLDNGITNITMSSNDNRNYNATNSSLADGSYTFRVYANDTSGNRNNTESVDFSINTAPDNSGTGGGSGGSSGESGGSGQFCIPNWSCGSWSFCDADLSQTRTCVDLNSCRNLLSKPEEKRECPDILFDSIVEIDTKRVYPWSELKFSVNLKEVNSSDLVDIEIVYRISRNNVVVYEQSETRAIETELIFEKNIDGLDLPPGEYLLSVIVKYGKNQTASSEQAFSVVGVTSVAVFAVIFVLLGLLGFMGYNWYKSRKETEEIGRKLEKIEKELGEKKKLRVKKAKDWIVEKIEAVRLMTLARKEKGYGELIKELKERELALDKQESIKTKEVDKTEEIEKRRLESEEKSKKEEFKDSEDILKDSGIRTNRKTR